MSELPYLSPGRTAVITGAADGIGRAAALKFCQQNSTDCRVMFVDDAAVAQ